MHGYSQRDACMNAENEGIRRRKLDLIIDTALTKNVAVVSIILWVPCTVHQRNRQTDRLIANTDQHTAGINALFVARIVLTYRHFGSKFSTEFSSSPEHNLGG